MRHTNRGVPKILKQCKLPLTAAHQVNLIVTEMAVMEVREDGLHLLEVHPSYSVEDIVKATEAKLIINDVLP